MTGSSNFTAKEKERFRKLLEVANSTTYQGEKDAAVAAATRLARSHGMSLREAAGMRDEDQVRHKARKERPRSSRTRAYTEPEFGQTFRAKKGAYHNQSEAIKAEKQRYDQAMADAIRRGLEIDEKQAGSSKKPSYVKRSSAGAWRSRPDFIRVLLRETGMSAREIAATVGVSVHDVFKEKLLMRQA